MKNRQLEISLQYDSDRVVAAITVLKTDLSPSANRRPGFVNHGLSSSGRRICNAHSLQSVRESKFIYGIADQSTRHDLRTKAPGRETGATFSTLAKSWPRATNNLKMTVKRRNHGRNRHGRNHTHQVVCDGCGCKPAKDKAIKRFTVRNIVDKSSLRDLMDACVIESYVLPKFYIKLHYCVSCAVHRKTVRPRARSERTVRANPRQAIMDSMRQQGGDKAGGGGAGAGSGAPARPT